MDNIETEVAAMLAKLSPLTPEAHRKRQFDTLVCELLTDWKWPKRQQVEIRDFKNIAQAGVHTRVKSLIKSRGAIIAMAGDRGTGKTTIAAQIAIEEAWKRVESMTSGGMIHRSVFYTKLTDLLTWLKPLYSGFGSVNTETLESLRTYLAKGITILVIDELHECANVTQKTDILTDILDRRYAEMKDTILISNQTPDEFYASIGGSVLSRIQEHGSIIPCKWKSWRNGGSIHSHTSGRTPDILR